MEQKTDLQNRAIGLIGPELPANAEETVANAVRWHGDAVRRQIRSETGLRLSDAKLKNDVPVRVVPGFPFPFAQLISDNDDALLWRLIMMRPQLDAACSGFDSLLQNWSHLEHWTNLPAIARGGAPTLERARDILQSLRTLAETDRIIAKLRQIDEDVLGAYWHSGHIEIYWMAIAVFAGMARLSIEDLTVVVLTHEIAHAYTHLGLDIGGACWSDDGFQQTDRFVTEGLAQFYTSIVTQKLRNRLPMAFDAYEALLKYQSPTYHAHETWFTAEVTKHPEIVRFALLRGRGIGKVLDAEWRNLLETTHSELEKQRWQEGWPSGLRHRSWNSIAAISLGFDLSL
jgi:hypothetical protein